MYVEYAQNAYLMLWEIGRAALFLTRCIGFSEQWIDENKF